MTNVASIQSAIAIGFTFPIIGAVCVGLRFYTRWHLKNVMQIDDWLCIPAWLCLTGCCASLLTGVLGNAFDGEPSSDPSSVTGSQRLLAQTTGALVIFYYVGNALVKMSILFFYRRIFIGRVFRISIWIIMASTIIWLVYGILVWLLYCGINIKANFEGGWAVCPVWGFEIQIAVFLMDSVIDLAVLILPVPFIWRLQLNLSRKIIIAVIFLLGGLAFVASVNNTIIQLVFLLQPATITTESDTDNRSNSFFQGPALFYAWPPVELGVGVIASNLPSLSFRVANSLPRHLRRGWDHVVGRRSTSSSTELHKRSIKVTTAFTVEASPAAAVESREGQSMSDSATAVEIPLHEPRDKIGNKSASLERSGSLLGGKRERRDSTDFIPKAEYFLNDRRLGGGEGGLMGRKF